MTQFRIKQSEAAIAKLLQTIIKSSILYRKKNKPKFIFPLSTFSLVNSKEGYIDIY